MLLKGGMNLHRAVVRIQLRNKCMYKIRNYIQWYIALTTSIIYMAPRKDLLIQSAEKMEFTQYFQLVGNLHQKP